MSDGHSTARFANSVVALIVIGICYKEVPFTVDHVGVQIMRAAGVVNVVPRVNPSWIRFVGNVDDHNGYLAGFAPLTDVGVGIARVDELVLLNDVFPAVVFQIFNVQNLGVRVFENANDFCVFRVGNINNVHVVPAC